MFNFFYPSWFIAIFSGVIGRDITVTDTSGVRGAAGFAAEPGFSGAVAVISLASLIYVWKSVPMKLKIRGTLMCILMVIVTKSGTGSFLFLLLCGGLMVERIDSRYLYSIPIIILLYVLYKLYPISRGLSVVEVLITNPQLLWQVDTSTGARVFNIVIGSISLLETPLGNGVGTYDSVSYKIVKEYDLYSFIVGRFTNISAFAKLSVEFGFLFLILILLINLYAINYNGRKSLKYLLVANAMVGVSFSFIFPPIWLLYSMALARREYR